MSDHLSNWRDRLKGSCCGVFVGIVFFFGAFPLLFWNEQRAVQRYDALEEAETQVKLISGMKIDPQNEGKLLHFSVDVVNGGGPISDPIFGVECNTTTDCLILHRYAEMYQWDEEVSTTTTNETGTKISSKTYRYNKQWLEYHVNSENFNNRNGGYDNPSSMRFEKYTVSADPILIGAYELPQELISEVDQFPGNVFDVDLTDISDESLRSEAKYSQSTGGYYFGGGNDTTTPQIGDQRVWFTETPSSRITIVGVQTNNTLSAFVSETGNGGDVLLFKQGNYTAIEMFDAAEDANKATTWLLRFAGFGVMSLGLWLVLRPIEVFADIIPILGDIIGCGISFISILFASILSGITISLAWLIYRPVIGAIVLAVFLTVIGCCAFGVKLLQRSLCPSSSSSSRPDGDEENGGYEDIKVMEEGEEEQYDAEIPVAEVVAKEA
jgi:hypothetical protein